MKRLFCMALGACCLTLALQRPAQAWSKFNFGVGFNLGWEGGGNSVLWGVLKGQNTPGAMDGAYGHGGHGRGYGQAPPMPPPSYAGGFDPGMMYGDAAQVGLRAGGFGMGMSPEMGMAPGMGMPYPMQGNPMVPPGMQAMPVQPMPNVQPMPKMPRADAQPVGYFTYPQQDNSYFYPLYYGGYPMFYPGMWYGY